MLFQRHKLEGVGFETTLILLRRVRSTYIPKQKNLCLFFQPVLIYISAVMAPLLKQFHATVYLVKRGILGH